MNKKRLAELNEGEGARVISVGETGDITARLMELGIVCGARVVCSFAGKGIRAFSVKGSTIAIRDRDSRSVFLEVDEGEG